MRVKISRGVFIFQSLLIVVVCFLAFKKCNRNSHTIKEKIPGSGLEENPYAETGSTEVPFNKSRTYHQSDQQYLFSGEKSKFDKYNEKSKFDKYDENSTFDKYDEKSKFDKYDEKSKFDKYIAANSTTIKPLLSERIDPKYDITNHLEKNQQVSKQTRDISDTKLSFNTSENGLGYETGKSSSKTYMTRSDISAENFKNERSQAENTRSTKTVSTQEKYHHLSQSNISDTDVFKYNEEFRKLRFKGFQLMNDNFTYVYAGYFDDRGGEGHVKVVAVAPQNITYNFTCVLQYPGGTLMYVTGHISYLYASCIPYVVKHIYAFGYIICPLHQKSPLPTFVSIVKQGIPEPKTNVTVWRPSETKNNITRCVKPFVEEYDNVLQVIWNIELLRIYGVDNFVFYLDRQTSRVVDILRSYEQDGIVDMRNFSINQPGKPVHKLVTSRILWAEFLALNDCLLSQINSAKYVLFIDVDEVLVPRIHKNVVDLADELFHKPKFNSDHVGSLLFRNVYFPAYMNITKEEFPQKDLAVKYNIEPLLHMTRMKTSAIGISPKSLVRPETVDVMCIHQPFSFKHGWFRKVVDEDVASLHHYRGSINGYMYPPETQDNYLLRLSTQLISAVQERLKKVGFKP